MPSPEPTFSILLLTYNRADHAARHVEELKQSVLDGHANAHLEILDNGSSGGLPLELALACAGDQRITLRHVPKNEGFGPGFNRLADDATGDILVFISDDVGVYGDFIPKLRAALDAWPASVICKEIVNWRAGWNVFGETTFSYPQGYFLACTRATWRELGGFDERFVPAGYEDVDLGYRMEREARTITALGDLPVRHQCIADERMEETVRLRAIFAAKWGLPNVPERP
jgi:GT2 family glycosyltransferase